MGKQSKIIGYCRLSLEEKDQGSSLASQRSEITSHVERLGLKGDLEFLEDDGWSGASKRRPAYNRLRTMVEAGAGQQSPRPLTSWHVKFDGNRLPALLVPRRLTPDTYVHDAI